MEVQKHSQRLLLLMLTLASTTSSAQVTTSTPTGAPDQNTTTQLVLSGEDGTGERENVAPAFNCMSEWLHLSGATPAQAETLPFTVPAVQSGLDEPNAKRLLHLFLSLILGYAPELATNLKLCVDRQPDCPVSGGFSRYPCGDDGECVFNSSIGSAVCRCPDGLTGERCDIDIMECDVDSLNHCSQDPNAACVNIYGSYRCECHAGYYLYIKGVHCEDIDECSRQLHNCSRHATCNNTNGSYTCTCSGGYQGDGESCEVDVCSSSANSELCRQIQGMGRYNKHLESKLEKRDHQIGQLLGDMKLMASIFAQHDQKISELGKSVKAEMAVGRAREKAEQCPLISWKSFAHTGTSAWNVQFNKTRSDTVIRVVYTSVFGMHLKTGWNSFTISVQINGSECVNPGAIKSSGSWYGSSGDQYTAHPVVVSGMCYIKTSGPLTMTVNIARPHGSGTSYRDSNPALGSEGTATLYIEELWSK